MQGKSVEEIMEFMDENEKRLSENPFERKSSVIIPEKKTTKAKDTAEKVEETATEKPKKTTKKATKKETDDNNE